MASRGGKGAVICDALNAVLAAVFVCCAAGDLRDYRIPNGVLAIGFLTGLLKAGMAASGQEYFLWHALPAYLGRTAASLALLFPLYCLRMTGAGDVKTAALLMACMGWRTGACALGLGIALGAVLALAKMLQNGSMLHRFFYLYAYIGRLFQEKTAGPYYAFERDGRTCVIPLGACFCAGAGLAAALERGWM